MKRKTEDHGTTLTTWEMLTPYLKFKFTTYKEPGQIITTASCRTVYSNGSERYSYGSEYMVEVDRTYHKRVTAPMVQSHHRSDVANLYDIFLKRAITWNVARDKMPAPLTEEEQQTQDARIRRLIHELEMTDTSTAPAATATYHGSIGTYEGVRFVETSDTGRWSAGTAMQAINRATRLDPAVVLADFNHIPGLHWNEAEQFYEGTTANPEPVDCGTETIVDDLMNFYAAQRTPN